MCRNCGAPHPSSTPKGYFIAMLPQESRHGERAMAAAAAEEGRECSATSVSVSVRRTYLRVRNRSVSVMVIETGENGIKVRNGW